MDQASIGGVIVAFVTIFADLILEDGNLEQILQPTAALIVFRRNYGSGAAPIPHGHRCCRIPQNVTCLGRSEDARQPVDP